MHNTPNSEATKQRIRKSILENYRTGRSVTSHPEHVVYYSMLSRCSDPDDKYYGGQGIKVCDRWKESFFNFLEDMGPRPAGQTSSGQRVMYTIERKDGSKDYSPENCYWATWDVQGQNRKKPTRFSQASIASRFQPGPSQHRGSFWITNGSSNQRVRDKQIPDGWRVGFTTLRKAA
jgi:hypothetical protein